MELSVLWPASSFLFITPGSFILWVCSLLRAPWLLSGSDRHKRGCDEASQGGPSAHTSFEISSADAQGCECLASWQDYAQLAEWLCHGASLRQSGEFSFCQCHQLFGFQPLQSVYQGASLYFLTCMSLWQVIGTIFCHASLPSAYVLWRNDACIISSFPHRAACFLPGESIWNPSPFANVWFINIFPSVSGLPFPKTDTLKSIFSKECLIKSKMTVFIIMDYAFGVKNSSPNPRSNRSFPDIFFRKFYEFCTSHLSL